MMFVHRPKSILTVMPQSGLANRMLVLSSAFAFSRKYGHRVEVIWCRNKNLNCRFDELFDWPADLGCLRELDQTTFFGKVYRRGLDWYLSLTNDVFLHSKNLSARFESDPGLERLGTTVKRIYARTNWRFFEQADPFSFFVPVASLRDIIVERTAGFVDVVGVHIRRSDHSHAIQFSPTIAFVELMRREIEVNRATRFFLATDSPETETMLRREFPGRIISREKTSLNRNDPSAIQDALVDLYCLSRTRKLIGSFRSTFSEAAWKISGIEHVIAGSHVDPV